MTKTNLTCAAAILLMASVAGAADIGWRLKDDGIGPQDVGNWNEPSNWTLGRIPAADDKVKFYDGTAECRITDYVVGGQLVMGDGGSAAAPEENYIHIMAGGTLKTGTYSSWSAVGYNRPAQMIVERGGTWETGDQHFWLGMQAGSQGSKLVINGGIVRNGINHALQCGRNADATGQRGGCNIYVNSGLMDCGRLADNDLIRGEHSSIDIKFGTLMFHRTNIASYIQDEIDAGLLTAFGEHGNDGRGSEIVMVVGGGVTTLTATDPMEASPKYGEEDVYYEDVTLSWRNKDPNNASAPLVNVWLGQLEEGEREPNKLGPNCQLVLENEPWTEYMSVVVGELDAVTGKRYLGVGEYYWQVELVNTPSPNPLSDWYYFTTTDNRAPWNVNAGADIHTWIGQATPLAGSYEDEGTPSIRWTSADPRAVFSPSDDGGATSTAINPIVTVDYAAAVRLTMTVNDGVNPPVSDDMTVRVWNDACDAARRGLGQAANHPADFTGPDGIPDCRIDLLDLSEEIAAKWLDDYALTDPILQP